MELQCSSDQKDLSGELGENYMADGTRFAAYLSMAKAVLDILKVVTYMT